MNDNIPQLDGNMSVSSYNSEDSFSNSSDTMSTFSELSEYDDDISSSSILDNEAISIPVFMDFRPEKIFENKTRPRVLKTIKRDNKK